jgi:hypothetical protein
VHEALALVAAKVAVFPEVCGLLPGITAGVLMALDKGGYCSWWVVGTMVLGLVVPLLVPAIASS